jgi:HAD superfamily hydrolase (TIGR01509 family)
MVRAPRFAAILFDLDGTLGDTLELIYHAFNEALGPILGREISGQEIRARFGPPDGQIIREWVGGEDGETAVATYVAAYEARHQDFVQPFPGMRELLQECADSGARIAVVTGKSRVTAIVSLEQLGLMPLVEILYGGDDVSRQKPDPLALELVLESFGISPDQAVMIGDSADDVRAGKAIGAHTIGVLWGSPDHAALYAAGPDNVATSVPELESLLFQA